MATPAGLLKPVTFQGIGTTPAVQICPSGSGMVNIYNGDILNVLLVAPDWNPGFTNSYPIQPLTNATVDGSSALYAVAQSGTVAFATVGGASQLSPSPAQIAQQINALGLATLTEQIAQNTAIPNNLGSSATSPGANLNHGLANLAQHGFSGPLVIAAGASTTLTIPVNRPGYVIRTQPFITAADATPFVQYSMQWFDSVVNAQIGEEDWYAPVPNSGAGPLRIYGKGPTKGNQLELKITNLCTTATLNVVITIDETTQHIPRDDWRSNAPSSIPGFSPDITADGFGGLLVNESGSLAAHTSASWIMPLYAGKGSFYVGIGAAGTIQFNAFEVLGLPGSPYATNQLGLYPLAAGVNQQIEQDMGRWPVVVSVANDSAAATNYTLTGVILEYAS